MQQQASLERESAKINRLCGQTVTAAGWAENLLNMLSIILITIFFVLNVFNQSLKSWSNAAIEAFGLVTMPTIGARQSYGGQDLSQG